MKKFLMFYLITQALIAPVLAADICTRDAADGGYLHLRDEGAGNVGIEYCLRDVADSCYRIGASRYKRTELQASPLKRSRKMSESWSKPFCPAPSRS